VLIPHYTQANKEKPYVASSGNAWGLTSGSIQGSQAIGFLDLVSAIDSISILPGAGSWVADSIATLYGLPL
jgi:hypothetical protein